MLTIADHREMKICYDIADTMTGEKQLNIIYSTITITKI